MDKDAKLLEEAYAKLNEADPGVYSTAVGDPGAYSSGMDNERYTAAWEELGRIVDLNVVQSDNKDVESLWDAITDLLADNEQDLYNRVVG